MPNWCANRLRVTGLAGDIDKVRVLMAGGGVRPHVSAVSEGIQLYLAGCAGFLRPATDEVYESFPALTEAGRGEASPENEAFTEWMWSLDDCVLLTESACLYLHNLWLKTGVQHIMWNTLSEPAQQVISSLLRQKYGDWSQRPYPGPEKMWDALCRGECMGETGGVFDMRLLLPTRLDVEINGFNGGLLGGVPGGCAFYISEYGFKCPTIDDLKVSDNGSDWMEIDFETPWSPPSSSILAALSGHCNVALEHWYAESGESFCGYGSYRNGELTDSLSSVLEWEEEDEDGYSNITGPEWILDNVAHYGG